MDFRPRLGRGHGPDATFDFLGFNHVWTRSRKGNPVVRQFTARDLFARAVKAIHRWCKTHWHEPPATQHEHLARVIRGHCNYHGRIGNSARLSCFRYRVAHCWRWSPSRRSSKGYVNRDRMNVLLRRFPLPLARLRNPDTSPARAKLPCEEPSASIAHARVCEGRGLVTTHPTRPLRRQVGDQGKTSA